MLSRGKWSEVEIIDCDPRLLIITRQESDLHESMEIDMLHLVCKFGFPHLEFNNKSTIM